MLAGTEWLNGQVSIKNDNPHQITFTTGETVADDHVLRVSVNDMDRVSAFSLPGDFQRVETSAGLMGSGQNIYFTQPTNEISVGKLSSSNLSENIYFPVTFQNNTSNPIGRFQLSFDFIYNLHDFDDDFTLSLEYRVNDSDFRTSNTGIIHADMLRSDEDAWNSLSMQLNISDLYLRPGDTVDFVWMIESETNMQVPIGLNRIDSNVSYHQTTGIDSGSLIITEILPPFMLDENLVEYIEIYNPSDYPVSAKGLEIRTPKGEFIIQDDVTIGPFDVFLVGNTKALAPSISSSGIGYSNVLLSESGGRVELIKNGRTISRAAYETTEPGTSLELDHVLNANDGYASLRNFTPSSKQIDDTWRGSPGSLGNTVPVYKHRLLSGGWHFYTPPGRLIEQLNRNQQVHFFDHQMNMKPTGDIDPYEPVLLFKEEGDPSYIHVEHAEENEYAPASMPIDEHTKMVHIPTHRKTSLGAVTDELGNRLTHAALLWNHRTGKFDLVHDPNEPVEGWQPIVVNHSLPELITASAPEEVSSQKELTKFIEFQFQAADEKTRPDRAMIGFINQNNSSDQKRYHLPKLLTEFNLNSDFIEPNHSFIYLASQLSEHSANSFLHLPGQFDEGYEMRLGYHLKNSGSRATLSWTLSDDIPDEWIVEITDTQTGEAINMRDHSRHTFNSVNGEREIINESESAIQAVNAYGSERFIVNIKPYESITEEEEETVPESVELRPNYPNPFNPATNIVYYLPESQPVKVSVYNVVGQQVSVLVDDTMRAGEHTAIWNASDMPSGIYIVQLETGNRIFTRKITLIK